MTNQRKSLNLMAFIVTVECRSNRGIKAGIRTGNICSDRASNPCRNPITASLNIRNILGNSLSNFGKALNLLFKLLQRSLT